VKSKKRFALFICLFILLAFIGSRTFAQSIFLQHYSTKNGLPSNNCYYSLQDSKGYIWVATDAGVSRFDGRVFENFSIDDGLPDNQILQLKEDSSGKIWFLALNGQISYFYNGKIYNQGNSELLKLLRFNSIVVSFFQDSKGRIWFGTNKNLLVMWDGKTIMKYISADKSRQFINSFIHEDAQGKIWAYSNTSVRVLKDRHFEVVKHRSLPISYKTAINLPDKSMAFLDKAGLNVRYGKTEIFEKAVPQQVLTGDLGYYYLDEDSGIWISNTTGVHHIEKNGLRYDYVPGIAASQVIKDAKDNMWFTTANGMYMLPRRDERMYVIGQKEGLSRDAVKSIAKAKNRFWLGMDEGMLNVLNLSGLNIRKINLPNQQKYNVIKQINYDSVGNAIYFASDYGLGRINNADNLNSTIDYLRESNNSMFVIKSFSLAKNKSLSLALSSGVVILPDRDKSLEFSSFSFNKGQNFFPGRAYCVFYDNKQNLWFSSIIGLSELIAGNAYNYYKSNSLLTRRINDIQQMDDGTIVLATDGYGLVFLKNNQVIRVINQKDGLANNICKKLFVKNGNVWVVTNDGINKISFPKKNLNIESFEYTNSLLKDDVNGLHIDDHYAYFATNSGVVYFQIAPIKPYNEAPKVYITSIINNQNKLDIGNPDYVLNPSNNSITFYYSAVDFQNKNITYRYRLKADADWTETRTRRLEFSSLEPGKYSFELSAKSNGSSWSKPALVFFELEKHFWQSLWFMAIVILVGGAVLYIAAVTVTRKQKNKEQAQLLVRNKILMLEQRALQAMMNPHFVFNVMNSIQHYINTKDTGSANKVLTGFARLIRKNLEICTKSYISVEEEIEYLELYLSLEKKRFGGKLNYEIKVDPGIDRDETLIPSMILQPYIENAIWHGIMPKEDGGTIGIVIGLKAENTLLIEVKDDGIGIDNSLREKKGEHVSKGMSLTKERVNLLNQVAANSIQINIKQDGNSGTLVSIEVPINP
jgi:ligand-binding sensor domain-containing protein